MCDGAIEATGSMRQRLVLAGLEEINEFGFQNFSTRRVAKRCGVSCAAPYKHFEDTQAFIAEIFGHMNGIYNQRQQAVLEKFAQADTRTQLIEVSMEYIRFLVENPQFRRVVMLNFQDCDEKYRVLRGQLSVKTYEVVSRYCQEVGMPPDVRRRKTFIVRAIIYSAAMFFDNGELEYNEKNLAEVRALMSREFDLP